jgi:hypothetical protein
MHIHKSHILMSNNPFTWKFVHHPPEKRVKARFSRAGVPESDIDFSRVRIESTPPEPTNWYQGGLFR